MRPTALDPTKMGCKAQTLEANLRSRVVGQAEAVEHIANVYQMYLSGMTSPGRPIANFLFLGPTGSGKTRVVEATAECLFDNPRALRDRGLLLEVEGLLQVRFLLLRRFPAATNR